MMTQERVGKHQEQLLRRAVNQGGRVYVTTVGCQANAKKLDRLGLGKYDESDPDWDRFIINDEGREWVKERTPGTWI